MSVTNQPLYYSYTGTGAQTAFTYGCKILENTDLIVKAGGITKTNGVDYTVTGAGAENGGTVTFAVAPASGVLVEITRELTENWTGSYPVGANFSGPSVTSVFDRFMMLIQQFSDRFTRALKVPFGQTVDDIDAAEFTSRHGKVLGFNSLGKLALMAANYVTSTGVLGNPWADVRGYTSMTDAVTQLGGTSIDLVVWGGQSVTADLTIPANIRLVVKMGGTINVSSGKTLTINSVWNDTLMHVFVGPGAVVFGPNTTPHCRPEWWGGAPGASHADMLSGLELAWACAIASDIDIRHSVGTYEIGEANFPYRNAANSPLLDCKNISIYGEGSATILKTESVDGADVLQLNAVKNLHVRNMAITATVSGSAAGSNGISITNGFDNITVDGVYVYNLGSLDKTTYIDGGKALTIQCGSTANAIGMLRARFTADGCSEGFGIEPDLVTSMAKSTSVEIDIIAKNCFYGVKYSSPAATGALSVDMSSGVRITGQAIDCQHPVLISRAHGIFIDVQVVTSKSAANRRLNPLGVAWQASDTIVEGVAIAYAKNATVLVHGNIGECDYKARIGGAAAGSSGLNGATEFSNIYLDLVGTAGTSELLAIDSGGNTMKNSTLFLSDSMPAALPAGITAGSLLNRFHSKSRFSGSFTAALTGCTAAITGTVNYSVTDNVVTLEIPTIIGTSNTTAATLTGMPADIAPSVATGVVGITTDNGSNVVSRVNVETSGTITLYNGATSGVFTNTGAKGIQGLSLTYRR